jgi:hypothetical protein
MILTDGGTITFTAANDRFTEAKWVDVGLGPHDLRDSDLQWEHFEVVELGDRISMDEKECSRTQVTE